VLPGSPPTATMPSSGALSCSTMLTASDNISHHRRLQYVDVGARPVIFEAQLQ
jgi:hypothetical protein